MARKSTKNESTKSSSKSKGKAETKKVEALEEEEWEYVESSLTARIAWCVGLVACAFILASLLSFDPADPPGHSVAPANDPVQNWCGPAGAAVAHYLFQLFGSGVWIIIVSLGAGATLAIFRRAVDQPWVRTAGVLLVGLSFSGFHALLAPSAASAPEGGGGLLAIVGVAELQSRFNTFGAGLVLVLILAIGGLLAYDRWLAHIPPVAARAWSALTEVGGAQFAQARERFSEARAQRRVRHNDLDDDRRPLRERIAPARKARVAEAIAEDAGGVGGVDTFDPDEKPAKTRAAKVTEEIEDEVDDEYDDGYEYEDEEYDDAEFEGAIDEREADEGVSGEPQVFDEASLREKISKLPVRFSSGGRSVATDEGMRDLQSTVELEGYQFPSLDLLEDPEDNYSDKMEVFVREQATALEEALHVYKIKGEVVGIDSGPVITLYELKLAPGTKVSALNAISSDIARSLKAVNIRIVSNMQGRDTVGIEVPNAVKEKVRLKELMSHDGDDRVVKMKLPMFLGKDAHGEPMIEDLAKMPHMLIAGTTGSGKSVCLNTIIISFLYTKKPNELKLVLIDPKMVELSQFRDIPHLMCPVVTEMGKAAAIIEWAVTKMDERYELLAEAGVRDIATYNSLEWDDLRDRFNPANEREEARIPRKLPYIVFIIDELADLMMTHKEVETSIVRIAQKARAVGIHLVLATQRPQANVVTGLIKSNMPGRIAFKVASGMDSRIVLDQKGGELLLGGGDMLFLSPSSHKLLRAQGTLVEDRETRKVVRFLKDIAAPTFERQLVQLGGDTQAGDEAIERGLETAQKDPLFDKAVEIVLETKRGSVSLLQRRLSIGYTRASRLIDLMGMAGIIGDYKGTVAREVTISPEEWEAIKAQAAADARTGDDEQSEAFETEESDGPTVFSGAPSMLEASATENADLDLVVRPESHYPDEIDEVELETSESESHVSTPSMPSSLESASDSTENQAGQDNEPAAAATPVASHSEPVSPTEAATLVDDDVVVTTDARDEDEGDGADEVEGVEAGADDVEEASDEADGEYEYVYVDEDGNEIESSEPEAEGAEDGEEWEYVEVEDDADGDADDVEYEYDDEVEDEAADESEDELVEIDNDADDQPDVTTAPFKPGARQPS